MTHLSKRQFLQILLYGTVAGTHSHALLAQKSVANARVRTIAGTGVMGYEPEGLSGLPAMETPINNPYGVVVGADEALYFCEVDSGRIRRMDLVTGLLTTFAGNGVKAYSGDGKPALQASFSAPHEIRFDQGNNLLVVERDAHVVRRIDADTGMVSTIAGVGEAGFSGDGGPATEANLRQPHSIALDSDGNILICDIGNQRVRTVNIGSGIISTLSGTGKRTMTPDTGPLMGTALLGPRSITTDPEGNAYLVLREGNAVFRLNLPAGTLQRIAGTGDKGHGGDGAIATLATFNGPKGIAYSAQDHSLYIVDTENHAIRRMDLQSTVIDTVLGTGERGDGPDGDPLQCKLNRPHGVFVHKGIIYVTDSENHRIRTLTGLVEKV